MLLNGVNIFKLGNSFKLKNGITIYTDPYAVYDEDKADIILISHEHADSCSVADVEKLLKDDTVVITTESCALRLGRTVNIAKPGDELEFFGVKIQPVHAYNPDVNKRFHIKGNGIGFILKLKDTVIYYSGHTDFIPEMRELGRVDIALLAIGHPEVMDITDAEEAVNAIKAPVVIPFYYLGDEADRLRQLAASSKVVIL